MLRGINHPPAITTGHQPEPSPTSTTITLALPTAFPRLPRLALPAGRVAEHLVVLAPLVVVPLAGTTADLLHLALVLALLVAADTGLAALAQSRLEPRRQAATALGMGAVWLAALPVLGTGPMVALGLFLLVRAVEQQAAAAAWPVRLGLAALATALVVDLSFVTLGLERSSLWLALGATIGTGFAAARLLETAGDAARAPVEMVLMTAMVLVLASYGALPAQNPTLAVAAAAGGYLTVPLLALAILRLAPLALEPQRRPGIDPLAVLLLAAWALAAVRLLGQA